MCVRVGVGWGGGSVEIKRACLGEKVATTRWRERRGGGGGKGEGGGREGEGDSPVLTHEQLTCQEFVPRTLEIENKAPVGFWLTQLKATSWGAQSGLNARLHQGCQTYGPQARSGPQTGGFPALEMILQWLKMSCSFSTSETASLNVDFVVYRFCEANKLSTLGQSQQAQAQPL